MQLCYYKCTLIHSLLLLVIFHNLQRLNSLLIFCAIDMSKTPNGMFTLDVCVCICVNVTVKI